MKSYKSSQSGTSLIEVLVAILVLSVGMLAYVGLHAEALQFSKMAQYRSVATQMAADYINRAQANSEAAVDGFYDFQVGYAPLAGPIPVPGCGNPAICTGAELAAMTSPCGATMREFPYRVLVCCIQRCDRGWGHATGRLGDVARPEYRKRE